MLTEKWMVKLAALVRQPVSFVLALLALVAVMGAVFFQRPTGSHAPGQTRFADRRLGAAAEKPLGKGEAGQSIPFSEIGAKATADYKGDAIGLRATKDGARLHTGFQKLAGSVTRTGLQLNSTAGKGGLRLVAKSIGRKGSSKALPASGSVSVQGKTARFVRAGLTEEYSVSADGVRQDFVVAQRPAGKGDLRVELALSGAKAKALKDGAQLTLNGSGRVLAYNRLQVTDAKGRKLNAKMEISAPQRLALCVSDANAVYPVRIDPTFSDANWVSLNSDIGPGTNGYVKATAVDGSGNLYIGGSFTTIGSTQFRNIAKWNGTAWSALGTGMDSEVRALAVDTGGNLYAGGSFTTAGGVNAIYYVAKWNGTAWSALGTGMDNEVTALAVDGSGNLYAGGYFTTAGGLTVNQIAKWNGTSWSALGTGMDSYVYALAVDGSGSLYAGGNFTTAGGVTVNRIAKWNGTAWSALSTGTSGGQVDALVVDGSGNLYAGGLFNTAGGVTVNRIAKWNGTVWSALGTGMGSNADEVKALAVDGSGNLYAGGSFTTAGGVTVNQIAKWNGTAWSALGTGTDGQVDALAVGGSGNLYAGGGFTTAGGVSANYVAKWNGTAWSALALGSGMNRQVKALAVDGSGNLYAGGDFTTAGGLTVNHIAKWNGTAWSALSTGTNGWVNALVVDGSGNLYAGGGFTTAGGVSANYVAKWNGTAWSALGTGTSGEVTALAVGGSSNLYVAGYFNTAGGVTVGGISKWNGTAWSALGTGMDYQVTALAVDGSGNLYAGGYFSTAGGVTVNGIAKWNGTAWSALGTGLESYVDALAVDGSGNLYAGGGFTTAGGVSANYVAKWNGTAWSPLGTGMDGVITALTMNGTDLYSGGYFSNAGGVWANRVAKWNGTSWSALGTGTNGQVIALAADANNHLFVGGAFYFAGSTFSPYVVQANLQLSDSAYSLTIDDKTVTEGNTGTVNATFTVTLSPVSTSPVTVDYAVVPGTTNPATAITDYGTASDSDGGTPGTLTIPAGQTTGTITVPVNGDISVENNETFFVNLSNQTNAIIADAQGVGTITNDDIASSFVVTKTADTNDGNCDADCSLREAITAANADSAEASVITFASGLTLVNEDSQMPTQVGQLSIIGPGSGILTVRDTSARLYNVLSTGGNDTSSQITVKGLTLSHGQFGITHSAGALSLDDVVVSDNGKEGLYIQNSGTVATATNCSFTNNDNQGHMSSYPVTNSGTFTATNCAFYNNTGANTHNYGVMNMSGATLNLTNSTISNNNDNGVNNEGTATLTNCTVTQNTNDGLYNAPGKTMTLKNTICVGNTNNLPSGYTDGGHNILGGTASLTGLEVDGGGGPVLKNNGGLTQTVAIVSNGTAVNAGDNALIPNGVTTDQRGSGYPRIVGGTVDIGAYESSFLPPATLAINSVTANEGNSGTTTFTFTVTRSNDTSGTSTVHYSTSDGTSTAGSDYTAIADTTLNFVANETTKTINVTVTGDTTDEADETFNVTLSNASGATISTATGIGTITNDDTAPTISIDDVSVTEGNTGTATAAFTASLSAVSGKTVTVQYATADGTATIAGNDYVAVALTTLTFTPGQTSKTVNITVNGDTNAENNETFFVNLTNASNATISDAQGVGTITDDDVALTISIDDVAVPEGNAGNTNASFTVMLSAASSQTITVQYATADGTAQTVAPADYGARSGTLTFSPGQTSKTISTIPVVGDTRDENDETFFVNLSNPTNATIGDNQGVCTIIDDDEPAQSGSDFVVNKTADTDDGICGISDCTLREAITAANSNTNYSAITFDATVFATAQTINLSGALPGLSSNLGISGPGAGVTVQGYDGLGSPIFWVKVQMTVSLSQLTISQGDTGGIIAEPDSNLNITNCTISGNSGGGIYTRHSTVHIYKSTISGNSAVDLGAAITNIQGELIVESSTISGNTITGSENWNGGAAIWCADIIHPYYGYYPYNAYLELHRCTVTNNNAPNGGAQGAILMNDGALMSSHSIVAGNGTQDIQIDANAAVLSAGYNLIGNAGGATGFGSTDQTGVADAKLGPLANNGGPTQTHALLSGSPAINAGDPAYAGPLTTDQRGSGFARVQNGRLDIGAFESSLDSAQSGSDFVVNKTSDTDDGACTWGDCTLREAINAANSNADTSAITFAPMVFGSAAQTINLTGALPDINSNISIDAGYGNLPGATVRRNTGGNYRILQILSGTVSLNHLTLSNGNATDYGGGIRNLGSLTVSYCTISGNTSALGGGGIINSGTLTISYSSISGNTDTSGLVGGGGVFNGGTMTVTNCSISGNSATGGNIGGGIVNNTNKTLTLSNSTINGNTADDGGGIFNRGTLMLSNSTISGNTANGAVSVDGGGAIDCFGGSVTLNSCTITNNSAPNAASGTRSGLWMQSGTLSLGNTIVAGNITRDIQSDGGTLTSLGYNLVGSAATSGLVASDQTGVTDAKLGPLAQNSYSYYYSPPLTHALLSGSPAVNAGDPAYAGPLTYDEDGHSRIQGGRLDIGAFESSYPMLSINDVTVTEGNTGTGNATFTVTLSDYSSQTVTVDYATAPGTSNPATAGSDYTTTSGTLTFAPYQISKTITVPVLGDTLDENNETFFVNLSNATNATLSDGQGLGTINDNDPTAALAINDITFNETTGPVTNATFTVTLSPVSGRTVTVNYTTADGTAHQPDDYNTRSGTLTFQPGQTTKTIAVGVKNDNVDEVNETFKINLSGASGANIGDNQGVCTIVDDDTSAISINDVTIVENDSGPKNMKFTVSLSTPNSKVVTVNYATADNSAKAGSDYVATSGTVTFSIGQTVKTFIVQCTGDLLDEDNETYFVNLTNPTNATISDNQGVGTINDNDLSPTLSINDITFTEGNSGTTNATFTVTLSAVSGRTVSVNFATVDGTAKAGEDYNALSGTVTFLAGQTSKTITVGVKGDTLLESDETFKVNLSGAVGANIGDTQGVCSLTNDDPMGAAAPSGEDDASP